MSSIISAAPAAAAAIAILAACVFMLISRHRQKQAGARRGMARNHPESLTRPTWAEQLILGELTLSAWPGGEWAAVLSDDEEAGQ